MTGGCCDVPACGGRCGAQGYGALRSRGLALLRARARAWRLRAGRWAQTWTAGRWCPVVPVLAWWPARVMDELPF